MRMLSLLMTVATFSVPKIPKHLQGLSEYIPDFWVFQQVSQDDVLKKAVNELTSILRLSDDRTNCVRWNWKRSLKILNKRLCPEMCNENLYYDYVCMAERLLGSNRRSVEHISRDNLRLLESLFNRCQWEQEKLFCRGLLTHAERVIHQKRVA